jgi:hypothetical protein
MQRNNPRFEEEEEEEKTQTTLAHILDIDVIAMDALMLATLQDSVKYEQLMNRKDQEAQYLLNLLQAVRLYIALICPFHDKLM